MKRYFVLVQRNDTLSKKSNRHGRICADNDFPIVGIGDMARRVYCY